MTFARRRWSLRRFSRLLAPSLASCPAWRPRSPPRAQLATQPAAAPLSSQAYTLPPDKLAKAIALNRIRNILDIVSGLWGLAVLWLLLATRAAAGLESWAQRLFQRRWMQGLLFFAVLLVITTLASLPLDLYGHHVSRAYGISVQGWGGWFADQAKSLGLTSPSARPFCSSSTGSSAAGRAATGSAPGLSPCRIMVALRLRLAASRAHLQQVRAARQEPSRPRREA